MVYQIQIKNKDKIMIYDLDIINFNLII